LKVNRQREFIRKQARLRDELLTSAPRWLLWYLTEHLGDMPEVPAAAAPQHPRIDAYGPRRLSFYDQRAWR
jgi:hypothetical protein